MKLAGKLYECQNIIISAIECYENALKINTRSDAIKEGLKRLKG